MNRALLSVAGPLVACSLLLVNSQYQARRLFIEIERAQVRKEKLDAEWDQLQYEQSVLADHARIDRIARNTLGMSAPGSGRTQYLNAGAR